MHLRLSGPLYLGMRSPIRGYDHPIRLVLVFAQGLSGLSTNTGGLLAKVHRPYSILHQTTHATGHLVL